MIPEYLSVFSPNTGKYVPEITPYLDTFHAVRTKMFSKMGDLRILQYSRCFPMNIAKLLRTAFYRTPLVTDKVKYKRNDIHSTYSLFHMANLFNTTNSFRQFDKATVGNDLLFLIQNKIWDSFD